LKTVSVYSENQYQVTGCKTNGKPSQRTRPKELKDVHDKNVLVSKSI